jgi:hypothetical protein
MFSTLMMETEGISETLGFITTLTRMITSEDFNIFTRLESFESYYKPINIITIENLKYNF